MNKSQATNLPAGTKGVGQTNTASSNAAKQQFIGVTIAMSWQLAVVVLVPMIGGFKLDQHFKTQPFLTIVGFVVALIGMVVIVRRTIRQVTPVADPARQERPHD